MRGGKRKGAGRPKLEATKVVRVPVGCLKSVTEIKTKTMESVTEIKKEAMKVVTETKKEAMKSVTGIKNKPIPKKFRKWMSRKNDPSRDSIRNRILDEYGSLQNAVNAGVKLTKNNIHFP